MKTVISKHKNLLLHLPTVNGSKRVQITDHKCTVPDHIAVLLLGLGEAHYHLQEEFVNGIAPRTKILIIRDTGIGDVLLCTPLVQTLHRNGAIVDFMCNASNMWIFERNPYINEVYPLEKDDQQRSKWDVCLDLRHVVENLENGGWHDHRVTAFSRQADITHIDELHLDYFMSPAEEKFGYDYLASIAERRPNFPRHKTIAYIWRSSHWTRNWSENTNRAVIDALSKAGYTCIIIDGARLSFSDLPENAVDATGQLSLREVAAVMKACTGVLTPDTGLFHLAGALDCPTVTYFGPMAVEERHTHKFIKSLSVPGNCALWPCRKYNCLLNLRDEDGQPKCIAIPPQDVVNAFKELIR